VLEAGSGAVAGNELSLMTKRQSVHGMPPCSPAMYRRLPSLALAVAGFSLLVSASPALHAQAPPDIAKLVRDASWNELHASNTGVTYEYRQHSIDNGKSTVKEIVETRDGDVSRLLAKGGKPLSDDDNQKELARLDDLLADPSIQEKKHKHSQEESGRQNEMLVLLPSAFRYTYLGMAQGPNGPCYRLGFTPDASFVPPDQEGKVYHGMAGELWIDQGQQRMVRFDAHLISDVEFGWGIAGKLYKGGTILVQQKDVGDHHWEATQLDLHLDGKILMIKSLTIHSTEDDGDFKRVPDEGYKAAVALLKAMPLE
jgi:hypothetical protein